MLNNLPSQLSALQDYNQFILCKLQYNADEKKLLKLPLNYKTFRGHNPLDPSIWLNYDAAVEKLMGLGNNYGIGFVLTESDPFFCLDIDGCLYRNALLPEYMFFVDSLEGCATEVSQSLEGLHVWGKSQNIPNHTTHSTLKINNKPVELYSKNRFIFLMGEVWLNHKGSAAYDATKPLNALIDEYFTPSAVPNEIHDWLEAPHADWSGYDDDKELIEAALKSRSAKNIFTGKASFSDLWTQNVEVLSREFPSMKATDDYDASRVDAALAQHLAFWTGNDCERMLRLMHMSGLKREKWEREEYLRNTILNAVNRQTQFHKRGNNEAKKQNIADINTPQNEIVWHDVSISDIHTNPPPSPVFLIESLLPEGVVTLLGGHGGAGKSMLALQAAVCLAMGLPFFGKQTIKSRVLFFSAEDTKDIVRFRLSRICNEMKVNLHELGRNLRVIDATDSPCLYTIGNNKQAVKTKEYDQLMEEVKSFKVLIVDNASDTFDANENERAPVRKFLRSLVKLGGQTNITVLLLAHVDKSTAKGISQTQGYSGSTAWHNTSRSRLFLTTEDNVLKLEHQKLNFGPLAKPIYLTWTDKGVLTSDPTTETDIQSLILQLIEETYKEGVFISPHPNSTNNAFLVLKDKANFPRGVDRKKLRGILEEAERKGYLQRETYKTGNRKEKLRYKIVAPSAPSYLEQPGAGVTNHPLESAPTTL